MGQFSLTDQPFDPLKDSDASLSCSMEPCSATTRSWRRAGEDKGGKTWRMIGDPTEGAMVVAAAKAGLWRGNEQVLNRVSEIPFDSERKRMTTIHQSKAEETVCNELPRLRGLCQGGPDIGVEICESIVGGRKRCRFGGKEEGDRAGNQPGHGEAAL